MTWEPTDNFLKGVIVKPFLPLDRLPDLKKNSLRNLFPGDEVYVFEVKDSKWARGYVKTKPYPRDYLIPTKLDELPPSKVEIAIFPLSCAKIIARESFGDLESENGSKDLLLPVTSAETTENTYSDSSELHPLPRLSTNFFKGYQDQDQDQDIIDSLEQLCAFIYATYSYGDFKLFNNLCEIYYSLNNTRIKLANEILTHHERELAKETITFLLNKSAKLLASSSSVNEESQRSQSNTSGASGFKSILARDAISGKLLSKESSPLRIAFNQVLCALDPNFPINAHNQKSDYSLKPIVNKRLHSEPPSEVLVEFKSLHKTSNYQPPGLTGMILYFYLRNNQKRLSEAFAVQSAGTMTDVKNISSALFPDLPRNEVENNRIYLVASLVEEIEIGNKGNDASSLKTVKKGLALGVADVTRVYSKNLNSRYSNAAYQFTIKLYCSFRGKKNSKDEAYWNDGWGGLVDRIISGSNVGIAVNPRAEKVIVSVKRFKHEFTNKYIPVANAAPIARIEPLSFDPLAENYERVYLQLGKLKLFEGNKDDLLTITVAVPKNDAITFAKASNQEEGSVWPFVSVCSEENIGEVVKINGISLKNQATRVLNAEYIAVSLYVNGILEGTGSILYKAGCKLYEYDIKSEGIDIVSIENNAPVAHLDFTTRYMGRRFNLNPSIEIILQFDKFFQLGQQGIDEISSSLKAFCELDIPQLVKYFSELMATFYKIADFAVNQLEVTGSESLKSNIFRAIIYLIDAVCGRQDQYFYMVDSFLDADNDLPKIGVFLLEMFADVFANAETNWNSISRPTCRTAPLLLKLAIAALDKTKNPDIYEAAVSRFFETSANFLAIKSNTLLTAQVYILEIVDYVASIMLDIDSSKILKYEVSAIAAVGVRGLGADDEKTNHNRNIIKEHKLTTTKLLLIDRLLGTEQMRHVDSRSVLIARAVEWAIQILEGPIDIECSRLATRILMTICNLLWNLVVNNGNKEEIHLCFSLCKLLPTISKAIIKYNKYTRSNDYFKPKNAFTYLFPTAYPFKQVTVDPTVKNETLVEILVEMSVVFSSIAKIGMATTSNEGYEKILKTTLDFDKGLSKYHSEFESDDIMAIISSVRIMRQGKFFPEQKWLSLYASIVEGCLVAMEFIRPTLISRFIPQDESGTFERSLWGSYLRTLLKLATLTPVSSEHLLKVQASTCYQITGDMRKRIASSIKETWSALAWDATESYQNRFNLNRFGGYQVEFINKDYAVLQDLMPFVLQKHEECQAVGIEILWSLMVSELILSDSLIEVQKECLLGFYNLFHENGFKPREPEQLNFVKKIRSIATLHEGDEAFLHISNFIDVIDGFLQSLESSNEIPSGVEFESDRLFQSLKINTYLKDSDKPEMLYSFINKMYEDNLAKNDNIQAALCLNILASIYSWDHHVILPATLRPKFPEQTSFERKEALYKMIAVNFTKGNCLERAADTYNELLEIYEQKTYDLKRFAYVHNKLAKLYLEMESSEKLSPSYFKVYYFGTSFPSKIRGKLHIYEGLPFEHITSIHDRLQRLFPGARILSDDNEVRKIEENGSVGKFLHVKIVEPVLKISDKLFNTSLGVRQYAKNKDLRFFASMTKLPGATSVLDLWTEETIYETYQSFPTLLNRSDIKSIKVSKLSPLENAIRAIVDKTNELVLLESVISTAVKQKTDYSSDFADLSRQLSGTVDAPVNGGVGQYRVFFSDAQDDSNSTELLRDAFNDLTVVLNRCLELHAKLVSPNMKAAHDLLAELFRKNFDEEITNLNLDSDHATSSYESSISTYPSSVATIEKRSTSSSSGNQSIANYTNTSSRTVSMQSSVSYQSLPSADNASVSNFSAKQRRSILNWSRIVK
ncbi:uncharacterized protein PRCAT00003863001 [Priceomyces carsonii]|uniref:uncharacterized protein n=1 Tax=Priceomyces carsonii TaxID=28549 RepID=UPI002ED99A02|nr:unnamed protein product [Priceomyces carsonii]